MDPITFEVVKHRLWQINDEQAVAIKTISASPIVVEGNDFNVGLFTLDGRVVFAGIGSLVHVTTMGNTIENILAHADQINPGDAFLTNDPYLGALHQNDVVVASPLFWDGELVLWVSTVLHHPDVGGIDEGSFCINARSLYQEPPRYFLKVVDRGRLSREVEHTFVTNSRLPDMVALDLRAQIGAVNVAQRRLQELIEERGLPTVLAVMERCLTYAEERLRERIRELPDGSWSAEVFMDGDRVGSERILRVCARLDKRGEELLFDYTGSDPQVDAAVNCTYYATYAGSVVPIYTFLCDGEIDWNDAVRSCVRVVAPEGTVVNARFPAPCSISTVGFRWLVTAAATKVVACMLVESDRYRDRVCPSWTPSSNCNNVFGTDARGRRVGALLSDHRAGGAGARSFGDGISHAGQVTSFASSMGNVENAEWKLPVLYLFRRQLVDSGGPGTYRGGLTGVAALVPDGTRLILKSTNTAGTDQSNASGLCGGYPGAGSQTSIVRRSGVWDGFARGEMPVDYDEFRGELVHLPSKADAVLEPDDVLIFYPPGGGGYGDPLLRDPVRVAADVLHSRVSRDSAARRYGVALGEDGQPDVEATQALRARIRRARLDGWAEVASWQPAEAEAGPGEVLRRLGDALELVRLGSQQVWRCRCCGHMVGPDWRAAKARVARRAVPLAAAGPWLAVRWQGHSPNFELEETLCPACGLLFDVSERRKEPLLALDASGS